VFGVGFMQNNYASFYWVDVQLTPVLSGVNC
jgi:hypothetical protein